MATNEVNNSEKKGKKRKKSLKSIKFEEETITRAVAKDLIKNANEHEGKLEENDKNIDENETKKARKSRGQRKENLPKENKEIIPKKLKKHKENEVVGPESPENEDEKKKKKLDSIRAKKREKHAKLQEEKRTKSELSMQEKVLNYLSRWKHSRNDWKFEKLRQVWLQQHLFDVVRVPQDFWEILVEYFNGSKGQIRESIVKDALKIVENEDTETEEDENKLIRIKRAHDIVQSLS